MMFRFRFLGIIKSNGMILSPKPWDFLLEHGNYLDVRTILNKMIPEHDQMELVLFDPVIQCNIMHINVHPGLINPG